ncbi:hypothetical protein Tsubulata_011095 [Turnera subulata]|uniref:Cytochrome P450 n=1 Tax=Turnera subulata TaxID=218843 RepID=A0A9Q0F9S5_9ROSI|nr:hypothetical protein Tsubulata_011095 [Turnera subulata]
MKGIKKNRKAPPEPAGSWPVIGHLHVLAGGDRLVHRTLGDMADKYGPIFSLRLGIHQALVVSDWEAAKECLGTNDRVFLSRPKSMALEIMAYNHAVFAFSPYGKYWRDNRKLATIELLSHRRLELMKHVRDTEVSLFVKELYNKAVKNGGSVVVEMKESMENLTMNIIVRMIAGKQFFGNSEQSKAFSGFLPLAGLFLVSDAVPFLGWLDLVMGTVAKMKRTAREMDRLLGSWVNEHRQKRLNGNIDQEEQDFIHVMLSILDAGQISSVGDTDTTIKANCLAMVLGGSDTTVISLTWALSLVMNNRNHLKKAQAELDDHVGKNRLVNESDIKNLVYLQAIVKETLRLYPPGPLGGAREATEDCEIAGFHVPAGTRLVVNVWKLHRDPRIWSNPLEFQPERFLRENANVDLKGLDFEYLPFGSGRRMCPGMTFALQIVHLTLARLLQGFELGTMSDAPVDMSEGFGMAMPRATPLDVVLKPRGIKRNRKTPPEPAGSWPVIGHLHVLAAGDRLVHRTLGEMADKYGPILSLRLGIHRALVVSDWEAVKECFSTNDLVFLDRPPSLALKIMGYNQAMFGFAPYGKYWRDMRKLAMVELLSNRRLELMKHVRDSEVTSFGKELYKKAVKNGGSVVVEMKESMGDLAMNIIVRMIAGKRYFGDSREDNNEESRRCQKAFCDFLHLVGLFLVSDAVPLLGWLDSVMATVGKMKRTAREIDSVLGSWVNEHRQKRLKGSIEEEEQDFIHVMLSMMDGDQISSLHDTDTIIKANCLSLLLGGSDTSMITIIWAISLLLNNPNVLKKAQDELDDCVGKHRLVDESDIKNLVYLQAIVKETLRLYPAGPIGAPREAMEDCEIGGFHVPAGTRLFVNMWKLHRDPRIWSNPLDFHPERFLTEHINMDVRGTDFEYTPFGSGRRMCPGVTFALQVVHLTLARLLQGFELRTETDTPVDMSECPGMTLPRATPLAVVLKPRLSSSIYD